MRKLFLIAMLIIASVTASYAQQTFTKEGNTYKSEKVVTSEKKTDFLWEDSKKVKYIIYMGPSGSCYIKKFSQKTGKEYKQYLGEEVSKDICKQLGVEYKPTTKK